jgi:hypothetical protein
MRIHSKILSVAQVRVLDALKSTAIAEEFYLGGGTALALQLGHRRSLDLDWFSHHVEDPEGRAQRLVDTGVSWRTHSIAPGTLHGRIAGVKVRFLEDPHRVLAAPVAWSRMKCRLASVQDVAAMKIAAISSRGAKKDYVDVFSLVQHGYSLKQMLRWYEQKHKVDNTYHVKNSLVYFEDVDREAMPSMLSKVNWRMIKAMLRQWVKEMAP